MVAQPSVEQTPAELVPALPTFEELAIQEWQVLKDKQNRAPGIGRIVTSLVHMNDGSRYINRDIYPDTQTNDVEIEIETALGTRVSGANTQWGVQAAVATGSVVSIFGSNQNCNLPTSHAQDVWAASLVNMADEPIRGRKAGNGPRVLWGKSMGGMANNGKLAYAPFFGAEIALALNEDPSLAHQTSVNETVHGLTPWDLLQEGLEFGPELFRQKGESRLEHFKRLSGMRDTIGVTRSYVRTHMNAGRGIWHGDAGKFLPHIPFHQSMVTVMMNRNRLNHRPEYGLHQDPMPNAHIVDRNYKHLAVGRWFMVAAGIDALQTITSMLAADEEPSEVAIQVADLLERSLSRRD